MKDPMKVIASKWYYHLNGKLIKQLKPCYTGDQIHLHCFDGCYNVHAVDPHYIFIKRKGKIIGLRWDEFKCKKGWGDSAEAKMKRHLKIVLSDLERKKVISTQKELELREHLKRLAF